MGKNQTQKMLEYFEEKGLKIDDGFRPCHFYSIITLVLHKDGKKIDVAEGVSRRSDDKPNLERSKDIAYGRALKALYRKHTLREQIVELKEEMGSEIERAYNLSTEVTKTKELIQANQNIKTIEESIRHAERELHSVIHGRIHLLMA